jgi:hypothetical protein
MPQTRRSILARTLQPLVLPMVAGVMAAGPAVLFAAPPALPDAPHPRQADDDDDGPALLDDEGVNLIRVYEIDLETEPRVLIDRDDLEEFLRDPNYSGREGMPRGRDAIRDFLRQEGWEQLDFLFEMRARDYYHIAIVREEPETLRAWQRINTRFINGYFLRMFANKDLGENVALRYQGREIDNIPLIPMGRDGDRIAYTNFYILTQMTANGIPFIDRDRPEESLLVQWSLPREDARFPAPEIAGWEPEYRGYDDDDPRRDDMIEWVASLIAGNQNSEYGIDYLPPALQADEDD